MKKNVYTILTTATVRDAVQLFVIHHIGLLPVVDEQNHLAGIVSLHDMLDLALPSAIHMLEDIDYIGDFGAAESYQPSKEVLGQPVTRLMRPGKFVQANSGLIRAYAFMLQYNLHDIPVVDTQNRLIGIASRVDIGTTILAAWQ